MNLKESMTMGIDPTAVKIRIPDEYRIAVGYKPTHGFLVSLLTPKSDAPAIPGVIISTLPLMFKDRETICIPLPNGVHTLLDWEVESKVA